MIGTVQFLQILSGLLWLIPAGYLTPRIVRSWSHDASRMVILSTPVGFVSWLMFGFTARWVVWPQSMAEMSLFELVTWAALYLLSAACALWILSCAIQTRGE